MFCPECGTKLPEGSMFCSECGATLKEHLDHVLAHSLNEEANTDRVPAMEPVPSVPAMEPAPAAPAARRTLNDRARERNGYAPVPQPRPAAPRPEAARPQPAAPRPVEAPQPQPMPQTRPEPAPAPAAPAARRTLNDRARERNGYAPVPQPRPAAPRPEAARPQPAAPRPVEAPQPQPQPMPQTRPAQRPPQPQPVRRAPLPAQEEEPRKKNTVVFIVLSVIAVLLVALIILVLSIVADAKKEKETEAGSAETLSEMSSEESQESPQTTEKLPPEEKKEVWLRTRTTYNSAAWDEMEYNENGLLVTKRIYNYDAFMTNYIEYTYFEDGKPKSEKNTEYYGETSFVTMVTYDYDEAGRLMTMRSEPDNGDVVRESHYFYEGELLTAEEFYFGEEYGGKNVYSYDENGLNTEIIYYDGEGVSFIFQFRYYDDGLPSGKTVLDGDRKFLSREEYIYDAHDDRIKTQFYDDQGIVEEWNEYEYDEHHNLIRESDHFYDQEYVMTHEYRLLE